MGILCAIGVAMMYAKPLALVCIFPLASCALGGKIGLSGSDTPAAGPTYQAGQAPTQTSQPVATPENPPAGVPTSGLVATPSKSLIPMEQPVEVAKIVRDSVSAIPASMRVSPSKGAPVITLKGPSWCGSVTRENRWDQKKSVENEFTSALEDIPDIFYSKGVFSDIAEFACAGSRSADRFSWVRSYMQARANVSGMPQEHQAFLFSVASAKNISSTPDNCESYELKGESTTLKKYHNQAFLVGMGCDSVGEAASLTWWLDRKVEIDSHIKRLAFVYSVFKDAGNSLSRGLAAYHDSKLLDFDAYFAEMKKFGADDTQLALGMMKYYDYKYLYRQWSQYNQKEYGKNFAYVKKVASDGFDRWVQESRANPGAVKFAFGIEEALLNDDKSGFADCSKKANTFVRKLILRGKPKSEEEVALVGSHGIASLVLVAAYECEKHHENAILVRAYVDMLSKMEQTRGPRYASRIAVQQALLKKHKANSSYPLRATFVPPREYDAFGDVKATVLSTSTGMIKRIVSKGAYLEIQFEDVVRNDKHFNCVKTGYRGRRASGTVKRGRKCSNAASTRNVLKTDPVRIPKTVGLGLKKGQYATIAKSEEDPSLGYPVTVYKSKEQKKLISYYGIKL